jgi:hypothetical protein
MDKACTGSLRGIGPALSAFQTPTGGHVEVAGIDGADSPAPAASAPRPSGGRLHAGAEQLLKKQDLGTYRGWCRGQGG